MCIVICPYGRIQSALIDDHSLVIGYDQKRGEPRGHRRSVPAHDLTASPAPVPAPAKSNPMGYTAPEQTTTGLGDCVACSRCVQVCPTGIDIRQGLQMECIGCTACIDACDDVMTRLGRPKGLIRYDSQAAFTGERTRWFRPRTILYFVLLLVGAGVATKALMSVRPANASVTRMTGAPYVVDETSVRNQFLVRIVNKRNVAGRFTLHLMNTPAHLRSVGFEAAVDVGPLGGVVQPLVLLQPRADYEGPFHFDVRVEDAAKTFSIDRQVEFVGPDARLLREDEKEKHERR
jgi:cytochrome c oxidase accessory protein FixG